MTPKELRAKKDNEISAFMEKWRAELAVLKIQAAVGQCEKPAQIPALKKALARALTILNERKTDGVGSSQ